MFSFQSSPFSRGYHSVRVSSPETQQDSIRMALGILELTKVIESNTVFYHDYLVSKGIPLPTHQPLDLRVEQPYSLPDDVAKALNAAIEATDELHDLLSGPTGLIMNAAPQVYKLYLRPELWKRPCGNNS